MEKNLHWPSEAPDAAETPFAAPRCYRRSHVAYLKANRPSEGNHRENWCLYDVIFAGRVIVSDSKNPECDLARELLAEGITGTIDMLDAVTGKPRTVIDIEKVAKLTVEEGKRGSRFANWKPFEQGGR